MLFLLTGDIQCGKTRWLENLCREAESRGTSVAGVLAPGVWEELKDAPEKFYKLGINNVLLPSKAKVRFANRPNQGLMKKGHAKAPAMNENTEKIVHIDGANICDNIIAKPQLDDKGSSKKAEKHKVGWDILDDAVIQVNKHFLDLIVINEGIGRKTQEKNNSVLQDVKTCPKKEEVQDSTNRNLEIENNSLLAIDELGRLELMFNSGLTNAVKLLESGPSNTFPNAVAVVRSSLIDDAFEKFSHSWNEIKTIEPTEASRSLVLDCIYHSH